MKAKDVDLLSYLEAKGETFKKRGIIIDIQSMTALLFETICTHGIVVVKKDMVL